MGVPWFRGAAILGLVAVITALGASRTLAKALEQRREKTDEAVFTQATAFVLTFLALYGLRAGRSEALLLESFFPAWGNIQIFLLSWYAGYLAGKLSNPRNGRKSRKIAWLLFTLVFYGQLVLGLSGASEIFSSGTPHVPVPAFILFAPMYRGSFGMMPFLVLTATLLAGSAWCSMLCYFGSLGAVTGGGKPIRKLPPLLKMAFQHGRFAILILGVAVALTLRYFEVSTGIVFSITAAFIITSLIIILSASWKYTGMVHCTSFCPMGLVINLLARLSPWRMRIDKERCTECGACEKTCGYRAIDATARQRGQTSITCSLCRECSGVCPQKAVHIKSVLLPASMSGSVFTVIVVLLHVLFLAAARPM